ncbi:tRNA (adenosine(37)-N6)-threonylcarbamoyltransferase complex dimerization subunit type 1 TsaB [soil metagenome]
MSHILNIHTATGTAIVNLSKNGRTIATKSNQNQKEHAVFLHPAIDDILASQQLTPKHLDAVCVTEGPGSYTGIRVGLSAAKGLCFALDIPMITLNTLYAMACTAAHEMRDAQAFYCPMIDARRMEVYTALYDYHLNEIIAPRAEILDLSSLKSIISDRHVFFSGDGCHKIKEWMEVGGQQMLKTEIASDVLSEISFFYFNKKKFANIAYSKPLYLKEFYSPVKNV